MIPSCQHSDKQEYIYGLYFRTKFVRVVYDVTKLWNAKMADRQTQRWHTPHPLSKQAVKQGQGNTLPGTQARPRGQKDGMSIRAPELAPNTKVI